MKAKTLDVFNCMTLEVISVDISTFTVRYLKSQVNAWVSQKRQDQVEVNPRILQSRQQSGDLSLQILIIIKSSAQIWLDLGFTVNCVKTVAFLHITAMQFGLCFE